MLSYSLHCRQSFLYGKESSTVFQAYEQQRMRPLHFSTASIYKSNKYENIYAGINCTAPPATRPAAHADPTPHFVACRHPLHNHLVFLLTSQQETNLSHRD